MGVNVLILIVFRIKNASVHRLDFKPLKALLQAVSVDQFSPNPTEKTGNTGRKAVSWLPVSFQPQLSVTIRRSMTCSYSSLLCFLLSLVLLPELLPEGRGQMSTTATGAVLWVSIFVSKFFPVRADA
jgi:hypothetical protein